MTKGISFVLSATLLTATLPGCYSTATNNTTHNLVGVWESNTYGLLLEINEYEHVFYRNVGDLCLTVPLDEMIGFSHQELLNNTILNDDRSTIITTINNRKSQELK